MFQEDYNVENDPIANELLESGKVNIFGIVGLCFGILSIVAGLPFAAFIGCYSGISQVLLALAAIVLGIIGCCKKKRKKGVAIASIVIGAISLVIGSILIIMGLWASIYLISLYGMDSFLGFIGLR